MSDVGRTERHAIAGVQIERPATDGALALALVERFDLALSAGEIAGVVGETGAGKTLTMRAALGLLPAGLRASGTLALAGAAPISLSDGPALRRQLGRQVSCVLQNPRVMLDPLQRVGRQLCEGVVRSGLEERPSAQARAAKLLRKMGFEQPEAVMRRYPHQLSGGMAQRVATVLGMMPRPELLFLDEPTSALDAHVRIDVLELLRGVAREEGTAIVMVSHDLGLVSHFCDQVTVMYAGSVVEQGPTDVVVGRPRHPYTAALLDSSATFATAPRAPMTAVAGTTPPPGDRPEGCPFAPRCPLAEARCERERPPLHATDGDRRSACHFPEQVARRVGVRTDAAAVAPPAEDVAPSGTAPTPTHGPAVRVHEASAEYGGRGGRFRALHDVSFDLDAGRTLAVVGESGAGKSTLVNLVAGFQRPVEGTVEIDGRPASLPARKASPVQVVFQSPQEALNPFATIGRSIAEPLGHLSRAERSRRVGQLLQDVGLDPARAGSRPAAFSGGQLQRIVLARALAANPSVLICDEATSALDVSVQAQIANLVMKLQAEQGFACLLVTHDLGLAHVLADDVLVLRQGRQVELQPAPSFFRAPSTDYARGLLAATFGHQPVAHEAAPSVSEA